MAPEWWESPQRAQSCSGGTEMSPPLAAAQPGDSAWLLCCSPDSALGLVTAAGTSASSVILLPVTPAIFSHFMSGPGQLHLLSFLISNIPVATQSVWILSEAIP